MYREDASRALAQTAITTTRVTQTLHRAAVGSAYLALLLSP